MLFPVTGKGPDKLGDHIFGEVVQGGIEGMKIAAKGLEINKLVAFVSLEAIDSHAGWDCVVEGKAIIFV